MENNKNDWEEIKETAKELKEAMWLVFSSLFWGFMITAGVWAFLEAILQITLTFTQAFFITTGVGVIFLFKSWWLNRQIEIRTEGKNNINKDLQGKVSYKTPEGLYKCEECGEYEGEVKEKDLSFHDRLGYETPDGDGFIKVSCLCDGILCHRCKKNKIHRPLSNSYDEKNNDIVHHPYLSGLTSCAECKENKKETYE